MLNTENFQASFNTCFAFGKTSRFAREARNAFSELGTKTIYMVDCYISPIRIAKNFFTYNSKYFLPFLYFLALRITNGICMKMICNCSDILSVTICENRKFTFSCRKTQARSKLLKEFITGYIIPFTDVKTYEEETFSFDG